MLDLNDMRAEYADFLDKDPTRFRMDQAFAHVCTLCYVQGLKDKELPAIKVEDELMRESEVEASLCAGISSAGGMVRKVRWIGRVGAPDRLVIHPNITGGCCLVELKAPGKKPEGRQAAEIAELRKYGATVLVLDSLESVAKFVEDVRRGAL